MSGPVNNTDERNLCNDMSTGEYVSIGNYLSRPDNGATVKIATLPLPSLEFHNGCKVFLANRDYYVKLDNEIDIFSTDKLHVVIIINLRTAEHELNANDITKDNTTVHLSACFNNGIHDFHDNSVSKNIDKDCATVTISSEFAIDGLGNLSGGGPSYTIQPYLQCVSALRYQLCINNGIRVKRLPCSYKLIKECVDYSYSGNAYVTLKNDSGL